MSQPKISSQNPLLLAVKFKKQSASGSISTAYHSTGTVSAFLATSGASDAEAAEASLVATCSYDSANAPWWSVYFPASVLTQTLMDTHFASAECWAIVEHSGGVREAIQLDYDDYLEITPS
jgi:hypothetical protein